MSLATYRLTFADTSFPSLIHTHIHTCMFYTQIHTGQSIPQSQRHWETVAAGLLYQASRFRWEWSPLRGVMYPGQVIRSAGYSGPLGTHRTGATLFTGIFVHKGFPWIKCYRLQTQGSQRTHSCFSMSTMGDEAVHTPFLTGWMRPNWTLSQWLLVHNMRGVMVVGLNTWWRIPWGAELWGEIEWVKAVSGTEDV